MPNFDLSPTVGFNLVLKDYCVSPKILQNCRGLWSTDAINKHNEKIGLATTIWHKDDEEGGLYCLVQGERQFEYHIPATYTENDKKGIKSHINRFNVALKLKIPIYGILKDRRSKNFSSTAIYKLTRREPKENEKHTQVNHFELEDVTQFKEENIENPDRFRKYVESRCRRRYIIEAIESIHVHSVILNKLKERLHNSLPAGEHIYTEYTIDNEQADLVVCRNNSIIAIYEVKTQDTMKKNIRAALGQLVSYSRSITSPVREVKVVSNADIDKDGSDFLEYIGMLFNGSLVVDYICLQ